MEQKEIIITNLSQIVPKYIQEHEPYEYMRYEVAPRSKENQCNVAFYELPPKKSSYPYHYHMKNEEVFYIISGTGNLETPDGIKEIKAGDIIVCPASELGAHKISNSSSEEKLIYIDFHTCNSPEVIYYPNSDKVGVTMYGKPGIFYKRNSEVGYYEGE